MYKAVVCILVLLISAGAATAQNTTLVSVAETKQGSILQTNTYVGTIEYYASSKIPAERSGVVSSVSVDEGETVSSGKVLMTINKDVLLQNIAATSAKFEQQKLTLEKMTRDYERTKILYAENATTEQRYLDAGTDRLIQQYAVQTARADLTILQEEEKRSSVRAPYDGVIIKKYINKGDWVSAGSTVYEIAASRIEITVNLPQAVIQSVNIGGEVIVTVENTRYTGTVRTVIPSGNVASRTFPAKIDLNYQNKLYSGMDAQVSIPVGEPKTALIFPLDAVVKRGGIDVVFIVASGKVQAIPVKIIGYEGTNVGVEPDSRIKQVVTTGNERLTDGQNVNVSQGK